MLIRQSVLEGIRSGAITLAFRSWKRPTVRAGGTLLTSMGQLSIVSVTPVSLPEITDEDGRSAGYADRDALLAELGSRPDGQVYRIAFGGMAADPRIELRSRRLGDDDVADLIKKLERLDRSSADGPWTARTLRIIDERPGVRAIDLARALGQVRDPFKVNVRKLKRLGLTESLEVGYRLSPRGRDLLKGLK